MAKGLVVRTMEGLGDNLWSRPVVLALARLYEPLTLLTPWPQAYVDLAQRYPIQFGRPSTRLRTQQHNVATWQGQWVEAGEPAFRLAYDPHRIAQGWNHHDSLEASAKPWLGEAGVSPLDITMELPQAWLDRADALIARWTQRRDKPVVLVRPPTVRTEWMNPARNCDPAALQVLIDLLEPDHTLVGVASLKANLEWLARPEPQRLHVRQFGGELATEELFGLAARCWSVGANGFLVPLALATKGYAYILFGGNYGYNAPNRLLHPAYDMSKLGYSEPDRPCVGCTRARHQCNVRIDPSRLTQEFNRWRSGQATDEVVMGRALTATSFDRQYYEEHRAAGLDYLGFGDWQRRYGRWFADVLGWRGKRVLDLGCACGSIVRGFNQNGVRAHGVDINAHMIQLGQQRWPDMATKLAVADAANLSGYEPEMFDGLHCAQVAEHFDPDLVPAILREMRRVLKPGALVWWCLDTTELYERQGRRVETEDPTHVCVRPLAWWRAAFLEAGFEEVTSTYLPRLLSHPVSMLQGSSSSSPAKYDWDFLVLQAPTGHTDWGRVEGEFERVAIVASGPSLRGTDLSALHSVATIAVNSAIHHFPFPPTAWCTVDTATPNRAIMRSRRRWPSTRFYAAVPEDYGRSGSTATNRRPPREPGITYLRRVEPSHQARLSSDPTRLVVGNSSYGALGVAWLWGARRVAILGVDGRGGYAWGTGRPRNLSNLKPLFRLAEPPLREAGCEVVVGSPESVVDCWPRMSPREAIEWLTSGSIIERLERRAG